jgi:hypothetical protein
VSNQFRLTKLVDFIPYGTHSNLFQMDVSDLFSPPTENRSAMKVATPVHEFG